MRNFVLLLLATGAVATFVACSPRVDWEPEVVMTRGMVIKATTPAGFIEIIAKRGFKREYKWDECEKSVTLWPRHERFHGSLGIYYPGPGITWWIPCDGLQRALVDEGQQHFASEHEALAFLDDRALDFVYRNDGLAVGWGMLPGRSAIVVEVWQVLINDQKPDSLQGAEDDKIRVSLPAS